MSYNQLPPPPPDRVGMQPGGPYGGPQLAGPGGAYGPIESPIGQPVPGRLPPPEMTMAKPRSILGIQVILWILAAVAAVGDLFSVMNAIEYENPLALIGLAFAVYSTIQSMITPVQITRGKRWAWIWALVSAVLGLAIAAFAIVFGLSVIELTPLPVLIGVVLGGLYGTLTVLLGSKSARGWILMHRIERGEVRSIGFPAPGARGVLVELEPERPETKPGSVTFVQLALWFLALLALTWVWVGLRFAQLDFEDGLDSWESASSPFDHFMDSDLMLLGVTGVVGFAVLGTLAIISAVGLQRGRFWARVFTPVWVGLATVAGAMWVLATSVNATESGSDAFTVYIVATAAGGVFTVLAVLAFIMVFLRGVRSWTPGRQTVVSYEPGAQGRSLPGQPPTGPAPPGHPQQGYQAPQGYPQQQHQAPQQPGPYAQQPQPGHQPPQRQYPPQQPPYGGGY
ncbi:hypothetical protein [Glycomyces tritici]|uniref:Uncharacterized protein n=1 Tax=Glycomyces tritici TaxID=2665176 RepID=A0ABT7YJN1_9ACTN|nr:hypothetical protein [Glycomyces tritici]MDN3238802.1 hypothetical protein [Glycomyces tritici]